VRRLSCWKRLWAGSLICGAMVIASPAQTFTTLTDFDGPNGAYPYFGSLVQGFNGNFYGTTYAGGTNNWGTVFEVTPNGTLTTIYSFCSQSGCTDGGAPTAGLVQAANGAWYGTTRVEGANGSGTIFKITSSGALTTLYSFCSQSGCTDGETPSAGLVEATNGDFYGTTTYGGDYQAGTVFKITPSGALTKLHDFHANNTDGADPVAGLVQGSDGNFYGTAEFGGTNGDGTVFKVTPSGTLTTLLDFDGTNGAQPQATLIEGTHGAFYGTTEVGGTNNNGTVFKITTSGELTTLYSFCSHSGCTDGDLPVAGLTQAMDGNFYGTTTYGGTGGNCNGACGTAFKVTPSGVLTTLYSFDGTHGGNPFAGLVQNTNGKFYGTTYSGGPSNLGTVFSLSVGLGPFVKTLPSYGKVGAVVKILGTNLTATTKVTFNGTAAIFQVVSRSEIRTTVPNGATTGPVHVKTPGHTLSSNIPFRVEQ
jgi:uncharacterized repeat protein (TIGR03803 family)